MQIIWNVMFYSQHFSFHRKPLVVTVFNSFEAQWIRSTREGRAAGHEERGWKCKSRNDFLSSIRPNGSSFLPLICIVLFFRPWGKKDEWSQSTARSSRVITTHNGMCSHFPPTCTCLGLFETWMAAHYIIESARLPWFCEKIDRKQSKRKKELSFFFHFLRNRDEDSGCQIPFRRGFRFPICHPIAAREQTPLVPRVTFPENPFLQVNAMYRERGSNCVQKMFQIINIMLAY